MNLFFRLVENHSTTDTSRPTGIGSPSCEKNVLRQETPPGYITWQLPAVPSYEKSEELPPAPSGHNARQLPHALPSSEETRDVTKSAISCPRDVNNVSTSYCESRNTHSNETEIEDDNMGETNWRLGSNRGRGHVPPKSEVYWKTSWLNEKRGIGALNQATSPRSRSPPADSAFSPGRKPFSPGRKAPRFRATFKGQNGSGLEKIDEEPRKNSSTVTNQHEFIPYGDQIKPKTSDRQQEQINFNDCVDKGNQQDRSSPRSPEKPEQQTTFILQDVRLKDGTADWIENDGRAGVDYLYGNTGHTDVQCKEGNAEEEDSTNDTDNGQDHEEIKESTPPNEKVTSVEVEANVKYSDKSMMHDEPTNPTRRRFNLAKDCPRWDRCEYHQNNRCPYRHPDKQLEKYSDSTTNGGDGKKAGQDYNSSEKKMLETPSGGETIINTSHASSGGGSVFPSPQTEYCAEQIFNGHKMLVDGKTPGLYGDQISPPGKHCKAAFTPYNSPSCKQLLGSRWKDEERNIGGSRLFSTPKSVSDVEEGVLKRCSKKDMCPKHVHGACPFIHPSEERKYRIKPEVINTWVYGKPAPCYSGEECPKKMRCQFIHEEDLNEKRVFLLGTATWDEHNLGDEIWNEIKPTGNDLYGMCKEESWEDNNPQNQNFGSPEMVGVKNSGASWVKRGTHDVTSVSAIFDEWVEEQSDVLYSAPSEGLKGVQPEPVTPDISDSVAPTGEWAIKQEAVPYLAQEIPCRDWSSGQCGATSCVLDEMTPSRFRRTINRKTSDDHKTQLLHYTNDAGFHSPEQTAFTDRRTIMRSIDRHPLARACDVVSGNYCGKITNSVSHSNDDVNSESITGVCDNFPSDGQRAKWLAMNNGDSQVPNETQSLGLPGEKRMCSFGCQFPEVEKKPEDSYSSVQAANEEHEEGCMIRRELAIQNSCAQELSSIKPEAVDTCHDTDGSTADQKPRVEDVTLNVSGTISSKFSMEPNKSSTEECKGKQTGRRTSDEIDSKQTPPEMQNDKMRKVNQRKCESTKSTDGSKKPEAKRKRKITHCDRLTNLKTINGDDSATSTDDGQFNVGHGEGEGAKGGVKWGEKRRNARCVRLKKKNEEPDVVGGNDRKKVQHDVSDATSQRKVRDHYDICVLHDESNLTGADTKESKESKDGAQTNEHKPNKMTVQQTVWKPDKQHTIEYRKKTVALVEHQQEVQTRKGVRHREPTKQQCTRRSSRERASDKSESRGKQDMPARGHKPLGQREKALQEVNNSSNVLNEQAPVKMNAKTGERRLRNVKTEGKNRDPIEHKTAISSGSRDNGAAQIQCDVTDADCCLNIEDATQDKKHQKCSSHAGERSDRETVDLDKGTKNSGRDEVKRNKRWRSRASYQDIDRRHHHRTYNERGRNNREEEPDFPEFNRKCGETRETSEEHSSSNQMSLQQDWRMSGRGMSSKRREPETRNQERKSECQKQGDRDQNSNEPQTGSGTRKPEAGQDAQTGRGTGKSDEDIRNIGAKNVRNPRNWDSNSDKTWSEYRGGDQDSKRKSFATVKRPDRPIYDAGLARRRSDQYKYKVRYERV